VIIFDYFETKKLYFRCNGPLNLKDVLCVSDAGLPVAIHQADSHNLLPNFVSRVNAHDGPSAGRLQWLDDDR